MDSKAKVDEIRQVCALTRLFNEKSNSLKVYDVTLDNSQRNPG